MKEDPTIIDISYWNIVRWLNVTIKDIDWEKVKVDPQNIQGVYIKAGEGTWPGYPVDIAKKQYDKAKAAGFINVAWYHFAHPEYSPADQAMYQKARTEGRLGEQVADFEDTDQSWMKPHSITTPDEYKLALPNAKHMFKFFTEYLDAFDQAFGVLTAVYTGGWYTNWILWMLICEGVDITKLTKHPLINADYTAPEDIPTGWKFSTMWQHTSIGKVNGIPSKVDLNRFHGDDQQLSDFFWNGNMKGNVIVPPEPMPTYGMIEIINCSDLICRKSANPKSGIEGYVKFGEHYSSLKVERGTDERLWIETLKGWIPDHFCKKIEGPIASLSYLMTPMKNSGFIT